MFKGTPGPWRAWGPDEDAPNKKWQIDAASGPMIPERKIATVHSGGLHGESYAEANALLIAAAPKMLALLQEIEPFLADRADADHNGMTFVPNEAMRLLNEVREAIAATGEA